MCRGLHQQWYNYQYQLWYSGGGILHDSKIQVFAYADTVKDFLKHGRGKFRNLMIVGPIKCCKEFMLKPSEFIFQAFFNRVAWVGSG